MNRATVVFLACIAALLVACRAMDSRGDIFVANESGVPAVLIFRHSDGREVRYALGAREGILAEKKNGVPVCYLVRVGLFEGMISRAEVDAAKADFRSGIVVLVVEDRAFRIKKPIKKEPNQTPEPTALAVTDRAFARSAPASAVAHL